MTKFLRKLAIYLLILFGFVVLVFPTLLLFPNQYAKLSHEMNMVYSINRLKHLNEPKMLIIGGSGCGFGIDSEKLFLHYNKPIVNTGTHAGLGLRLQIELFKEYIKEGDVVIVIPEYQQYKDNLFYGESTTLRILSSTYTEGFKFLSLFQWIYLFKFIPQTFMDALISKDMKYVENTPYSKEALNQFGDVTMYDQRISGKVPLDGDLSNTEVDKEAMKLLVDFDNYVRQKKATMILFPPAYQASSFHQNKQFVETLQQQLSEAGCPFRACPSRYALPDSLFFDTPYHLSAVGTQERTCLLIEDIDQNLSKK
ncbi:MAG: hypothetical protein BWY47_00401 [Bacteroidetes bacterium ADurb.Bin302]|nr:MAG: hypothetical protein BWY47_00401 [Bacteroidetes bacterium ADurb.Bin302]